MNARVADVFVNGEWIWPVNWINRFPTLLTLPNPELLPSNQDKLVWLTSSGRELDFSTSTAWEDLRRSQQGVQRSSLVWFPQAIPRHSFLVWLIVLKKLKTQDVMSRWNSVRGKAGMDMIQSTWTDIFEYLVEVAKSNMAEHIIAKLVVGVTAYFVWEERNRRLFTDKRRNKDQLVEIVLSTVRMKLHTMRFKSSFHMTRVLQDWSLPIGLLVADDDCG
ncbi:uncharacterized protein LOC110870597 [Helianthus annuus]|uniref:uncharacterized protein LOC110870597 n=1 Tax=Helianthus annuus TaxID=4232 RepID=UPI000B905FE1|nr:uncharacterized protein LOC110870597 [Helianthus annuus]